MALNKTVVIDRIESLEHGELQVRTKTTIDEDGTVLSSGFHRHVVTPRVKLDGGWADTDISGEDAKVQAIANATWTDSVKSAYETYASGL